MRIHYLQHVAFEDPGLILAWAMENEYSVTSTRIFKSDKFPNLNDFDMLVIMGGPMSVYEESHYPWLHDEKVFIQNAIEKKKLVFGICLGAQLIASALGARVYKNIEKEIGWFPVELSREAASCNLFKNFPQTFLPLHWHGDTFDLPKGAVPLASSSATLCQAFSYGKQTIALQFHLEAEEKNIRQLVTHAKSDLADGGKFVMSEQQVLDSTEAIVDTKNILYLLLDNLKEELKSSLLLQ